jgi:hypothetical protein
MYEVMCQAGFGRGLRQASPCPHPQQSPRQSPPLGMSRSHQRQPGERSFVKRPHWYPGANRVVHHCGVENREEESFALSRPALRRFTPVAVDTLRKQRVRTAEACAQHARVSAGNDEPRQHAPPRLRSPLSATYARSLVLWLPGEDSLRTALRFRGVSCLMRATDTGHSQESGSISGTGPAPAADRPPRRARGLRRRPARLPAGRVVRSCSFG